MTTILWFLGIALFFYFMMRMGCGSHAVHGDEKPSATDSTTPSDVSATHRH